jgi:hypothetical protein
MRVSRIAILLATTLLTCQATAAVPGSAVFCSAAGGAKILAIEPVPDGKLRFGLSIWSPEGNNISLFGVADPVTGGWRYAEAGGGCSVDLTRMADGGFRVRADPQADCHEQGGQNATIGSVDFTPAQNEGPVATELDNPEAFQHAGRCAGGQ